MRDEGEATAVRNGQAGLSLALLATLCLSAAAFAWLAQVTSVIPTHVAREEALHARSNGVHFYDGGYLDDGDFLLLGEMPRDDYARGGIYFVGSSETRASIMPWRLPAAERELIHNYAIGDLRYTEVRRFLRMLIEERDLLKAGPEKTTIVLSLSYLLTRHKDLDVEIDRYVQELFERHRLYTYDWRDGVHVAPITPVERFVRIQRDWANRFLRLLVTSPSRVRPYPPSRDWRIDHLNEVMGEDWRAAMEAEVEELALLLDDLLARGVRVVAVYPPTGSWHDELPYDAAYRALVEPELAARGVPLEDFSDFLADEEIGDDVHPNYTGQWRLHEAYRALALRELAAAGRRSSLTPDDGAP